jgi:hypothetical protein
VKKSDKWQRRASRQDQTPQSQTCAKRTQSNIV